MSIFHEDLGVICCPPPVADHPDFKEAVRFGEDVEPVEGVDYGWVWEYAKADFDRLYADGKDLDDKANDLIKYLGGGTGLFTLALLVNVEPKHVMILWWAIPSFLCALFSIFLATCARVPRKVSIPARIEEAFRYANYFPGADRARGAFVGQWHVASEGLAVVNHQKARQVAWATWAFFATVVLLFLPVLAALLRVT